MLSGRNQAKKGIHTGLFHLYKNVRKCKLIYVIEKRSVVIKGRERITGTQINLWGDEYVYDINGDGFTVYTNYAF